MTHYHALMSTKLNSLVIIRIMHHARHHRQGRTSDIRPHRAFDSISRCA